MKITSFNPLISTKDAASAIQLFESLGFERHHTKEGIGRFCATGINMKDADGFHVDVLQGDGEWTLVRLNVDSPEEVIPYLETCGFHKVKNEAEKETVNTGSSRFNVMVSASRFILAVSQNATDQE